MNIPARYAAMAVMVATACVSSQAKVELPSIYADHMVLQQKSRPTVSGTAKAGATVKFTATWGGKPVTAKAGTDGRFSLTFTVPAASMKAYTLTFDDGDGALTLSDVLAGEVWLFSGQSNMDMPLCVPDGFWHDNHINNCTRELQQADYPAIRILQVLPHASQSRPADDTQLRLRWDICSPDKAGNTSAIAYFFARDLYQTIHVPVGVMHSSYGGASAEAWMSLENCRKIPELTEMLAKYEKYGFEIEKIRKNEKIGEQNVPTLLYNTMLYPLRVLPIRGALWYQGETNAGAYQFYDALMDTLITSWRQLWGYQFPFYYVQLAGFMKQVDVQPESAWAGLRHAQWRTLAMPRTGMATAVDVGNQDDIHPKNKQEVARRLWLLALNKTYGRKDVVCEAPAPVKCELGDGKATVTFNGDIHVRHDSIAAGFIASGADDKFVACEAKVTGPRTITLTAPGAGKLKAVRYSWADYPIGNIVGKTALPVLPFRSDDMTIKPVGKK